MNEMEVFSTDRLKSAFEFASSISKSGLVPNSLRGKPADIMIVLQMGSELGLKPMQSLSSINVIQGVPSMNGRTMLALIRAKIPGCLIKIDSQKNKCVVTMGRDKKFPDDSFTCTWDLDRAKTFGLLNKDNWRKQPQTMMQWRAVSEAARFVFPDVIMNCYIPEEVPEVLDLEAAMVNSRGTVEETSTEMKQQLSPPDKVKSESTVEDVKDLDHEAQVDIIMEIPNRDYVCPLGVYTGKRLMEIPIKELRDYVEVIETSALTSKRAMKDIEKTFIANASSYISKFDLLSVGVDATLETGPENEYKTNKKPGAAQATFVID